MFNRSLEKRIKRICKYEYDYFLDKANVIGIGCGYKTIRNITTNEICIQVFVKKKVPYHCLHKNTIIPNLYRGVRTDVIETGVFRASSLRDRIRPVTGGYSIGPEGTDVAGTYGGLVTDGQNMYMLSNNHVIAGNNVALIGNPILQPSEVYGGHGPQDIVAHLSKFFPMKFITPTSKPANNIDAAIGKVSNLSLVSSEVTDIGVPIGIVEPTVGLAVQMIGSTSEDSAGYIKSINATFEVDFGKGLKALFTEQILSDVSSQDGDSGALLFDDNRQVVGLVFSTNDESTLSNKIGTVLDALEVNLVTE